MPRKEIRVCQILLEVKVRVAGQEAVRVAVPARVAGQEAVRVAVPARAAGQEAVRVAVPARAAAVLARDPADSVSVRLVARRRPISREFPASKSNVPNAGQ